MLFRSKIGTAFRKQQIQINSPFMSVTLKTKLFIQSFVIGPQQDAAV